MTKIMADLLTIARTYGMKNHDQGIIRVPAQSKELMNMLTGRKIGLTPEGEPTSISLMDAWIQGWHEARRQMAEEKHQIS